MSPDRQGSFSFPSGGNRWAAFSLEELDAIFDGMTRDPASGRSCCVMEEYHPLEFSLVAGITAEVARRGHDTRPYERALDPIE